MAGENADFDAVGLSLGAENHGRDREGAGARQTVQFHAHL
jgi:hypothetical protein